MRATPLFYSPLTQGTPETRLCFEIITPLREFPPPSTASLSMTLWAGGIIQRDNLYAEPSIMSPAHVPVTLHPNQAALKPMPLRCKAEPSTNTRRPSPPPSRVSYAFGMPTEKAHTPRSRHTLTTLPTAPYYVLV